MMRAAAITIQIKGYRRWKFRKWLYACIQVQEKERRERERKAMMERLEQESFNALRREHGVGMDGVRTALAAWSACKEAGITTLPALNELLIAAKVGPGVAGSRHCLRQHAALPSCAKPVPG